MIHRTRSLAGLSLVLAMSGAGAGQAVAAEQKLTAGDGTASAFFGHSLALGADRAVVGAPRADGTKGAVYVFARIGDTWVQTGTLTASDGAANDQLGHSVAVHGDTLVAGAPGDETTPGAVYTFALDGPVTRNEAAKLTASDGASGDLLGTAVAVDSATIVAGAPGDASASGSVYTFARSGAAARTETAKLRASDNETNDFLGGAVAVEGDTVVAGAHADSSPEHSFHGSVYTFASTGAVERSETAKLTAGDPASNSNLGSSVAIDGDVIVAGSPSANGPGALYTFSTTGAATRIHTAKLTASDGAAGDYLGDSVAIDGPTIAGGAYGHTVGSNTDQGIAYRFARTGTPLRTETGTLADPTGEAFDQFGVSVAVEGETILAGSDADDVGTNQNQGSATAFFALTPQPPADPPADPVVVPSVSGFRLSQRSVRAGARARFSFTLADAASVRIRLERALPGRRKGKRCVPPKRSPNGRKCKRFKRARTLTAQGTTGANSVELRTKGLRAGSYRATLTATNQAGTDTATTNFKIRKAKTRRRGR